MNRPQNPEYAFTSEEYTNKVNSPATSPIYFSHFIEPLVEEALEKAGQSRHKIKILDMACGHAQAMKFMAGLPESDKLEITGLDLSADALNQARAHFTQHHPSLDIAFFETDAEHELPVSPESFDMATAVNAMAYKQGHMLKSLFNALKPGAKCVVNFFRPSENEPYMEFYRKAGCRIYERKMDVSADGRTAATELLVTDFSAMPDEKARKLGAQSFLKSRGDIEALAAVVGFEVAGYKSFSFGSQAINASVHNDVYTFKKPETAGAVEAGIFRLRERVTDLLDDAEKKG